MYNDFFGFSEAPFSVTPDPKFLYQTPDHQEALASMIYGIQEKKGFVSITGEVGTGKTTLIQHLLNNLDQKVNAVFIYQTNVTFEELLREILLELELTSGDERRSSLIRGFNEYLIQRLQRDEIVAVIIDEAQNLPKEVMEDLRLLSNLETPRSKLLQIVLVGQPELEAKLNTEQLRQLKQRIGIRRKIRPLTLGESKEYIDHRLKLVGSSSSKVFTAEAMSLICQCAQGIPRTINILCDNALLIGYSLRKKKIDLPIIQEVLSDMAISTHEESPGSQPEEGEEFQALPLRVKGTLSRQIFYSTAGFLFLVLVILLVWEYTKTAPENPLLKTPVSKPSIASSREETASEVKTNLTSTAPEPANRPKKIIAVEEGYNLSSLCKKYYNQNNLTLLDHILEFNPGITNPHLIWVNQKIEIPEITEESLIIESSDGTCKVHLGTFFSRESVRQYSEEPALKGKEIEITARKVFAGETWFKVMAGQFNTREEGLRAIRTLRKKGMLPLFKGTGSRS